MGHAELSSLPSEILLHILSFLEPVHITSLQRVSRQYRDIGRDDNLWRAECFEKSSFLALLNRRRALFVSPGDEGSPEPLRQAALSFGGEAGGRGSDVESGAHEQAWIGQRSRERVRILANWDPSYPSESVSWYDEYIQRHAPIAVSWLQQPQLREGSAAAIIEARGVALYRPDNTRHGDVPGTLLAVSPLDDGSICLWDVNGTRGKPGAMLAKSSPGILFIDGPSADNSRRSKRIDSGVTECVSIDSERRRAYFAVQSHLIVVDLQRLSVVGCESFPWSISSLSEAHPSVPLTVGTSLGLHFHDSRSSRDVAVGSGDGPERVEAIGAKDFYERSLAGLFDNDPLPPYAPLAQPGPLSILHTRQPGAEVGVLDDIYVAGRFPSILHYDRRKFPSIKGSIHSGARLCSLTSLPYSFSALDSELRRKGLLSPDQVKTSKADNGGRTLIACGEYNTKGSLELYGLRPPEITSPGAGGLQNSTFKNRQTSSGSKLLSVINHGTRLVFSNGLGLLKWFERDGFTEVRRHRIGHCEGGQAPSLFASMPGSDELARKLLSTQPHNDSVGINRNDLLFWTGERLGLIGFSSKPGFTAEDFEENAKTEEEAAREREERAYSDEMRQALERQADDVRFVRNLGLGSGIRG